MLFTSKILEAKSILLKDPDENNIWESFLLYT